MQKAKAFFLVCAGFFLLALSYHLGAQSATAQAGATGFGYAVYGQYHYVITPSGDVYAHCDWYLARGWGMESAHPELRRQLLGRRHGLHSHHLGQGQGGLPEV